MKKLEINGTYNACKNYCYKYVPKLLSVNYVQSWSGLICHIFGTWNMCLCVNAFVLPSIALVQEIMCAQSLCMQHEFAKQGYARAMKKKEFARMLCIVKTWFLIQKILTFRLVVRVDYYSYHLIGSASDIQEDRYNFITFCVLIIFWPACHSTLM